MAIRFREAGGRSEFSDLLTSQISKPQPVNSLPTNFISSPPRWRSPGAAVRSLPFYWQANATDFAKSLNRFSRLFLFFKIFPNFPLRTSRNQHHISGTLPLIAELGQIQGPLNLLLPQLCPETKPVCCSPVLDVAHYRVHDVILHQGMHIDIWVCRWLYWNTCWFLPHVSLCTEKK